MQTKDMWKAGKWKVVAGAATLSALGIGGLAMAGESTDRTPEAINLRDRVTAGVPISVPEASFGPTGGVFDVNDSPFEDSDANGALSDDSAGSANGVAGSNIDSLGGGTESPDDSAWIADHSPDDGAVTATTATPAPATPATPSSPSPTTDDSLDSAWEASVDSADSADGS